MNLFILFTVFLSGVLCGDAGVSLAEASMARIVSFGCSVEDPDVQWLIKQTDLMYSFVLNAFYRAPIEELQSLIQVIETFVSATIRGPVGIDIREAADVFHRYRTEYLTVLSMPSGVRHRGILENPRISEFALSLAFDLERHALSLPTLLSDPDFPLDPKRRLLLGSLSAIRKRLHPDLSNDFMTYYPDSKSVEYLEMLLDVFTKVEARYTLLCKQTGVDVAHTYRPMRVLRSLSWGFDIKEDRRLVRSVILPIIDDPKTTDFAMRVGRCLDFALRHHPFGSLRKSLVRLANFFTMNAEIDSDSICEQLMTKGFQWLAPRRILASRVGPTPSVDARAPAPMENSDPTRIRVIRLMEIVALRVPEIREVFPLIHDPTAMSKFENILRIELNREDSRIDRLAYDLTRFLKMPILHLPMMRERYLSFLSEEQFEGLRRIISCMTHLEPVVGARHKAIDYIDYALEHHDEIELISRGLEALTRLYKRFQGAPIRSGDFRSVARYRAIVGFLPAFVVFGSSSRGSVSNTKFRSGLEWIIDNEWKFAPSSDILSRMQFRLADPGVVDTVADFLGEFFPEFDEMSFALDRLFREALVGRLFWYGSQGALSDSISRMVLSLPTRIFAAAMQLGGMEEVEAPLRAQLLRIVPLFIKWILSIVNGQVPRVMLRCLYRVHNMLEDLKQTDQGRLQLELDSLESLIPPMLTESAI